MNLNHNDVKKFFENFNDTYKTLEKDLELDDKLRVPLNALFDSLTETQDPLFKDLIGELVKKRGDAFISDREVTALMVNVVPLMVSQMVRQQEQIEKQQDEIKDLKERDERISDDYIRYYNYMLLSPLRADGIDHIQEWAEKLDIDLDYFASNVVEGQTDGDFSYGGYRLTDSKSWLEAMGEYFAETATDDLNDNDLPITIMFTDADYHDIKFEIYNNGEPIENGQDLLIEDRDNWDSLTGVVQDFLEDHCCVHFKDDEPELFESDSFDLPDPDEQKDSDVDVESFSDKLDDQDSMHI